VVIVRTEVHLALADSDASAEELRAMGAKVLDAVNRAGRLLDRLSGEPGEARPEFSLTYAG
jgi:hypothetical protein